MKNIGKPCAGEPHARFDEGGQARACSLLYPLLYPLIRLVLSPRRKSCHLAAHSRLVHNFESATKS